MIIGLHDAEREYFGREKFPNYALMKISAYHKAKGDSVEWWMPLNHYDRVYSSKVFEFTPENPYLPEDVIKGGTGYGIFQDLPAEIDGMFPDYSIYPECDYAIGYITRGCIRKCPWCVVPKKEGRIHAYRRWQDIVRTDTNKLVLMDNNILASEYGISQLEELSHTEYRLDLNQGMDARLVTPEIADILSRIHWLKHIRFSCDQKSQIEHVKRVASLLTERGVKQSAIFIYTLITNDLEDDLNRIYSLRDCGNIYLYGQAEQNQSLGITPAKWQNVMARNYIFSGQWRKVDWNDFCDHNEYLFCGEMILKQ